jgi:hypothetical protein
VTTAYWCLVVIKSVFVVYLFFDFQCCDSFINLAVIESTCASIENVYKASVYFRVYLHYTTLCFWGTYTKSCILWQGCGSGMICFGSDSGSGIRLLIQILFRIRERWSPPRTRTVFVKLRRCIKFFFRKWTNVKSVILVQLIYSISIVSYRETYT